MLRRSRTDADDALRRFGRQERGYLDRVRAEALDDDLRRFGPRRVVAQTARGSGTRVVLELSDGTRLTLRLYWKVDVTLAEVGRISYQDEVGWIVLGRDAAREPARLIAYVIRVDVAAAARTIAPHER